MIDYKGTSTSWETTRIHRKNRRFVSCIVWFFRVSRANRWIQSKFLLFKQSTSTKSIAIYLILKSLDWRFAILVKWWMNNNWNSIKFVLSWMSSTSYLKRRRHALLTFSSHHSRSFMIILHSLKLNILMNVYVYESHLLSYLT